jgi:hypothetical protein
VHQYQSSIKMPSYYSTNAAFVSALSVTALVAAGALGYYYFYISGKLLANRDKSASSCKKVQSNRSSNSICYLSMDDTSIELAFQEASSSIKSLHISNVQDKLLLYGLFKQATVGNALDCIQAVRTSMKRHNFCMFNMIFLLLIFKIHFAPTQLQAFKGKHGKQSKIRCMV